MQILLWTLSLLLAAGAGYLVYRADVKRAVPHPWLTAGLRGLVVLLTLLLLLVPAITLDKNETQKPVILLLQDDSRSAAVALGGDSAAYRQNLTALVDKLDDKYRVVQWAFGQLTIPDTLFGYRQQATDIAAAMADAQEYYGVQNLGAIILATDGRYNQGVNPLYQPLALQSTLYTVALGDSAAAKDLRIAQVYANKTVAVNNQFEVRADVLANLCNGYNGSVQLLEGGNVLGSNSISIATDKFDRSVSFTIKAGTPGLHHYVVQAAPATGELNTANNCKDVFVEVVDEQKKILLVAAAPHPDVQAIKAALNGLESYKLQIATPGSAPALLAGCQVVILHQLPAQNDKLMQAIATAKKPVWYIVGSQTNGALLTKVQEALGGNMVTTALRDMLPSYNSNFTLFTMPQSTKAVVDKLPPLSVPAGNLQAGPSAQVLFAQRGGNAPLWVLQQGTQPVAVLAGEGIWRWRLYEYKNFGSHAVVDECIRQTVSLLAANTREKPFYVSLPKYVWSDQEGITLNAYLLNANNEQVNTPEAQLTIKDSTGRQENFSFEKEGNAYKLNIGIREGGTYTYSARTTYQGKAYTTSGSFSVESVPLELMETGADYPLLYSLAAKYNGSLVPASQVGSLYDSITKNENIRPLIQTRTETEPLVNWRWFFFIILGLAATEWLLRKYWMAQ